MPLTLLRFLNIMFAGLLAGTSFGIWIGLNPTHYSAASYLEQQQNLVQSLNALMITLVVAATLLTLISAFLQRQNKPVFIALLSAAILFISCMVITRFGNIPIQTEILTWTKDSLPGTWTILRDKWWTFHIARTVVELIAFALVAWTLVQQPKAKSSVER